MKIFRKQLKPNRFEYKPRFYDERKERLQQKIEKQQRIAAGDGEAIKNSISEAYSRARKGHKHTGSDYFQTRRIRREQTRRSNIILITVMIALFFLAWFVIDVYLPRFG